jgi:hypothetical protein
VIQVEVSAAELPVEPGSTAQFSVTIINNQDHDDHVSLEIEGIDVEWYALPVPSFTIASGQSQTARVLFRIARASECTAGTYPFLVRARSMETGDAGIQQAAITIKPFSSLQMDIDPKRAVSTFVHHANVFEVSVTNLGNHDETLDFFASDPDDDCAYEFETSRASIKPGHTEMIPLLVEPVTRPLLGSGKLIGFTITSRSAQDSYVSANVHGQVERRPFLSTLTVWLILIVALAGILWAAFRPRPAVIYSFTANPMVVTAGSPVTLTWTGAYFGEGSYIACANQPGNTPITKSSGSISLPAPLQPGLAVFTLIVRNGSHDIEKDVRVNVQPAPVPPKPRILSFKSSLTKIHQGDTISLSWVVKDAVNITLNPLNSSGDPRQYLSQDVKPDASTVFILTARGVNGDVVQRQLSVTVVPPTESLSDILLFKAKPDSIYTGQKSTLSWSVDNSSSVEIDNGVGNNLQLKGKIDVSPQQTTTYTITATDNRGIVKTQTVTVTVSEPPPPPQPTIPAPADGIPQ